MNFSIRREWLAFASLLALVCTGCRTSNPTVPLRASAPVSMPDSGPGGEVANTEPAPPLEPVVASVGDHDIYVSELLSAWMIVDSLGLRDMLENLVTAKVVASEAERIGIDISDEMLNVGYMQALGELEQALQEKQPGVRLDEWISGSMGINPGRYRMSVRSDVQRNLLAARVVRRYIYTQDWAEVRVLVVETREEAEAAIDRIGAGEPFARVAGELSIDPSGKNGGRVPPVVRNDSALSRLTYATEVGALGGPTLESERWLVLQPTEFHSALVGDWADIKEAIEASLAKNPVTEPEYWLWKVEMSNRSPASFEPFFELIGEPSEAPGP